MSLEIGVYADWSDLQSPLRLGKLYAHRGRGREVFEFEFADEALSTPALASAPLDPRLRLNQGRQHPAQGAELFGVFADASPDRWGRLLMQRRLERDQREGRVEPSVRLQESDYLLGVHDAFRVGALRLKRGDQGDFLDNRGNAAAPPFVRLRELEAASLAIEHDEDNTESAGGEWLNMLLAPGGSLGGARPKASVVDERDHLWIAKFPSTRDNHNVGAWELLVNTLALRAGLRVPESSARPFVSEHHTFMVKRFDRTNEGQRIHFASAMTLTGHIDGDDASTGASYLELAEVLIQHGVATQVDLRELWARIVFNMLVSNTDNHLRNHGFLLIPGRGWRLSEAYDMNPVPDWSGLRLNVSDSENALDLDLARSVAPYFRLTKSETEEIIGGMRAVVNEWPKLAESLNVPSREQDRMAPAFRLAA